MRLFTVAEANALIPWLEERFRDLSNLRAEARPAREALDRIEQRTGSNGSDRTAELAALRGRIDAFVSRTTALLEEIAARGCDVKDVGQGLVDFPYSRDGRIVYLCWKQGEDRIRYWHERTTGFAGRHPLDEDET